MLTPGVVQAAQCPNEAVRLQQGSGGLPECRGYELVSSFSKQGHLVEQADESTGVISAYIATVAEDGAQISVGSSTAALGVLGQESSPFGSYMFLHRSEAGGWSTEPLNPLQSQFSDQRFIGSDANTGTSLWLLHTPDAGSLGGGLYVRSSTGQFELIGPEAPSGAPEPASPTMEEGFGSAGDTDGVVGTSREFTHVVVQANTSVDGRFLWPGDETFKASAEFVEAKVGSLYEYAGAANPGESDREPVLVGVEGEPGHTKLIGECGTTLGTLKGNRTAAERKYVPHEISEDGDVVFFSPVAADVKNESCPKAQPAVQELYARIDEQETVDISEPSPSECDGDVECETNAAIPADAELEAASANGSKVFFASTQQLLPGATEDSEDPIDSARIGCFETEEAGGCNLYEYDFDRPSGERLRLVSAGGPHGGEVQGVIASSNDGSHVYFVAKGDLTGTEKNSAGKEAVQGKDNLYVYEPSPEKPGESVVVFIATLSPEDAELLWEAQAPTAQVTPDGDFLVFESYEQLTEDDESEAPQLFEYDASTKAIVRVSVSEKVGGQSYGSNGNIERERESPEFNTKGGVSNDGKTVVFNSRAALSPRASAAFSAECPSVYEYNWAGSQSVTAGEVHLVSDGKDIAQRNEKACGTVEPTVDGSGEDIWFSTSDPLTWEDGDTVPDIYDARVDGGTLPPAQAVGCTGSGCQQSPTPPPAGGGLGSELARSGENITTTTPPPLVVVKPKAKPKALTRAQKLAKALKACKKKSKKKRSSCEKQAKKLYGRGK